MSTIKVRRRATRVKLRGSSHDRGTPCRAGLRKVYVSLARVSGPRAKHCRFLMSRTSYKLTRLRSCRRPVLFPAKRKRNRWTFDFKVALPRGPYRAQARAVDRNGNKEKPRTGRKAFRVR